MNQRMKRKMRKEKEAEKKDACWRGVEGEGCLYFECE